MPRPSSQKLETFPAAAVSYGSNPTRKDGTPMDVLIFVINWFIEKGDKMPLFADVANPETLAVMIPITAVMGGIAIAIVAIIMGSRKKELEHKERIIAMEKGISIPQQPVEPTRPAYQSNRTGGFVLTLLGIALTIAISVSSNLQGGIWGLVPLAIGIGLLIASSIEKKEVDTKESRGRSGQL
jgi:hypothetical protein